MSGERLSLILGSDWVDIGDDENNEAGGVGIDAALVFAFDGMDADLLVTLTAALREALREALLGAMDEVDEDEDVSLMPQDARTLFSTLTVSSLNIKDS